MTDLIEPLQVAPGSEVRLRRDHDPGYTGQVTRPEAAALLADGVDLLAEYQDRLDAQDTFGVLLVLQGLDAAGKDSTIKHVMSGVNPQSVAVRAFKQPSAEDLNHDFLWRYQCALPGRGRPCAEVEEAQQGKTTSVLPEPPGPASATGRPGASSRSRLRITGPWAGRGRPSQGDGGDLAPLCVGAGGTGQAGLAVGIVRGLPGHRAGHPVAAALCRYLYTATGQTSHPPHRPRPRGGPHCQSCQSWPVQQRQIMGGARPLPAIIGAARQRIRPHLAASGDARGVPAKQ
jgi:Polyphosphate kinase 2 (PPK2)